jgi:hypothetical protein
MSTYYPHKLGSIDISVETTPGSVGVAFERARVSGRPTPALAQEQIADDSLRQYDVEYPDFLGSKKGAGFDSELDFPMDGWATIAEVVGASIPDTVGGGVARLYYLPYILRQIFYGESGPPEDDFTLTAVGRYDIGGSGMFSFDAPNGQYSVGDIVVIKDVTAGTYYPVQIAIYTADGAAAGVGFACYDFWPRVSSDGANTPILAIGDIVYSTRQWYFEELIGTDSIQHLSIRYIGKPPNDDVMNLGCHVSSATINWEVGQPLKLQVQFNRMRYTHGAGTGLTHSLYTRQPTPRFLNARTLLGTTKATDWYTPTRGVKSVSLAAGMSLGMTEDAHDADGLEGWNHQVERTPRINLSVPFDELHMDRYENMQLTAQRLEFMSMAGSRGYGWIMASPASVLQEPPKYAESNGMCRNDLVLKPALNTTLTGLTYRNLFLAMW